MHVHQRGFVLIVVLMLLVSLSLIVTAQIRRSTGGQLMTANSSQYALAETAAQTVLRYCESQFMVSPNLRVTTPGVRGTDTAAWRNPGKWLASETVPITGVTFPGVQNFSCLIEDATSELVPSSLSNDVNPETVTTATMCAGTGGISPTMSGNESNPIPPTTMVFNMRPGLTSNMENTRGPLRRSASRR
jgi:Tfp pilus assembly protein PilX